MLLSVQALRALAALAVATYHALQWADGGFEVGRAGVDVFFVISGFIMWHVTAGRDVDPGDFLWRRLTRVAPLYWLATLGVLGVALVWPAFLPEVRPGWTHLALSLAFIPHLDPRGLPFPTLPPGWTLDYEALFYLIFAGALPAVALCAVLGSVFIDDVRMPLDQAIWFGAIVLVAACSCAKAARWFPAAPKPLTWGTEEDWSDVGDLDWGAPRRDRR